jgi:hypothetical protein
MARLGKEIIIVRDKKDRSFYMELEFVINVNVDGYFTTTLNESDVKTILNFNVDLYTNGRNRARKGFFQNKTKEGLLAEIRNVLEKCMSRELIEEKIILRYSFCTVASFGFTMDGKIVPNMGWHKDGKLNDILHWQNGTIQTHATNPHPVGVQMYIKPFFKRTFKYLDDREKIEYVEFSPFGGDVAKDDQYYLLWLENICSTKPPENGKIQEMDYSEDRAKFFVNMFKSLCKLAHTIAGFTEPENLTKLIESGKYLMPINEMA